MTDTAVFCQTVHQETVKSWKCSLQLLKIFVNFHYLLVSSNTWHGMGNISFCAKRKHVHTLRWFWQWLLCVPQPMLRWIKPLPGLLPLRFEDYPYHTGSKMCCPVCLGQGQVIFHSPLADRQRIREVICQMNVIEKLRTCLGQAYFESCLSEGQARVQVFSSLLSSDWFSLAAE